MKIVKALAVPALMLVMVGFGAGFMTNYLLTEELDQRKEKRTESDND